MRIYLRCVWANKALLAGWLSLLTAVTITVLWIAGVDMQHPVVALVALLAYVAGGMLLFLTVLGYETLDTHYDALEAIRRRGEDFVRRGAKDSMHYCNKAGIYAALATYRAEQKKLAPHKP